MIMGLLAPTIVAIFYAGQKKVVSHFQKYLFLSAALGFILQSCVFLAKTYQLP